MRTAVAAAATLLLAIPGSALADDAGAARALLTAPNHARVEARLNGRVLNPQFGRDRADGTPVTFGADDGLRHGRNRLVTETTDPRGRRSARTKTFTIARGRPIAGARAATRRVAGSPIRLDGRSSSADSRGGPPEDLRWRVVDAPDGADPGLAGATGATAELRPDVAGDYAVELTVSDGGDTARDRLELTVAPDDPPIGVGLETLVGDGGITVAGEALTIDGAGQNRISWALVDRGTGRSIRAGSLPNTRDGVIQVTDKALLTPSERGRDSLLVVNAVSGVSADAVDQVAALQTYLGGRELTAIHRDRLAAGAAFSLIGVPTAPPGAAFLKVAQAAGMDQGAGMSGRLQVNDNRYGFVFGDYVPFSSSADGTIAVGDRTFRTRASVPNGFHAVVLDPVTLAPVGSKDPPFAADQDSFTADMEGTSIGMEMLADYIRPAIDGDRRGALVFIQTFGTPRPDVYERWNGVLGQIRALGGTGELFATLDGQTSYGFLGHVPPAGLGPDPAESSSRLARQRGETGTLTGTLSRTAYGAFEPAMASPAAGNLALTPLAYQTPEAFPAFAGGQAAAYAWAVRQLITAPGLGLADTSDLRKAYWSRPGADWTGVGTALDRLARPAGETGFTDADLTAVTTQLGTEVQAVRVVLRYFDDLTRPLADVKGDGGVQLQAIGRDIADATKAPIPRKPLNIRSVFSGLLKLTGRFITLPNAAAISTVLASAVDFSGTVPSQDGTPVANPVVAKTSELGLELVNRINALGDGVNKLRGLMLSDWGKLRTLAASADTPAWKLPATVSEGRQALLKSSRVWFWSVLLPEAYTLWGLNRAGDARNHYCNEPNAARSPNHFYPLRRAEAWAQYRKVERMRSGGADRQTYALGASNADWTASDDSGNAPSGKVSDGLRSLFGRLDVDPNDAGLGAIPATFFQRAFTARSAPAAFNGDCRR